MSYGGSEDEQQQAEAQALEVIQAAEQQLQHIIEANPDVNAELLAQYVVEAGLDFDAAIEKWNADVEAQQSDGSDPAEPPEPAESPQPQTLGDAVDGMMAELRASRNGT